LFWQELLGHGGALVALGLLTWRWLLRGLAREEADTDAIGSDACDLSAQGYD
jgi:hypothetical protein